MKALSPRRVLWMLAVSLSYLLLPAWSARAPSIAVRLERVGDLPSPNEGFSMLKLTPQHRTVLFNYVYQLNARVGARWVDRHIAPIAEETYYPATLALNDLSIYIVTGSKRNLKRAIQQFDYSLTFENQDGLIVAGPNPHSPDGWIGRDSISRFIYSMYIAYQITGDVKYLLHADQNARLALQLLPRAGNYATNNYMLFYSTYSRDDYTPTSRPFINPNQDAAIALSLYLLFNDPNSQLYHDSGVLAVVRSHLEATMSIQLPSGEIPVAGTYTDPHGSRAYDTIYGGYTLWSWAIIHHFLQDPVYEVHLKAGADWLAGLSEMPNPVEHVSYDNPDPSSDSYVVAPLGLQDSWERLLVFSEVGRMPREFGQHVFHVMQDLTATAGRKFLGREFNLTFLRYLGFGWDSLGG